MFEVWIWGRASVLELLPRKVSLAVRWMKNVGHNNSLQRMAQAPLAEAYRYAA